MGSYPVTTFLQEKVAPARKNKSRKNGRGNGGLGGHEKGEGGGGVLERESFQSRREKTNLIREKLVRETSRIFKILAVIGIIS